MTFAERLAEERDRRLRYHVGRCWRLRGTDAALAAVEELVEDWCQGAFDAVFEERERRVDEVVALLRVTDPEAITGPRDEVEECLQ